MDEDDRQTQILIASLWTRNRPILLERLDLLERAADAAQGSLAPDLLTEATQIAHNLAGSLGMFGFPHGTQLARALLHQLQQPTPDPTMLHQLTSQLRLACFPQDSGHSAEAGDIDPASPPKT